MSNEFENIFKPILRKGNPIRDIGKAADKITQETTIPVIRLHLGNPSTEQFDETKLAMVQSIMTRSGGYGPHPGSDNEKENLAHFFNDAEGVPNHFCGDDAVFFPGATLITKSIIHLFNHTPNSMILLSRPGYPVYENQAYADHCQVGHYSFDKNGLITFDEMNRLIAANCNEAGVTNVRVIIITYPHNPTGKALSIEEAKQVADVINRLNQRYPNIIFYNDSVYSATCAIHVGYNSFYKYLTQEAQLRTITGASGAKLASMGGERIGGIATKNKLLRELLMNAQSQMTAGVSVHSISGFLATTKLLLGQWHAGIAPTTHRAHIADFYQSRIDIIANALQNIDANIIKHKPVGGMYIYADFTSLLKGKLIPENLQSYVGSKTFECGKHLRDVLLSAHKLGYAPVSTVNGEIFGEAENKITLRISCVERHLPALHQAVNTFIGTIQTVLHNDLI
jgi:aspartate/methionine/tyrosine aminotransferase